MREVEEALGGAPPCDSCNLTNGCILCCCCGIFELPSPHPAFDFWFCSLFRGIFGGSIFITQMWGFLQFWPLGGLQWHAGSDAELQGSPAGGKGAKKERPCCHRRDWDTWDVSIVGFGLVSACLLLIDGNHFIPTSESLLFQHQGCVLFALLLKRTHIRKMWRQDVKIRTS